MARKSRKNKNIAAIAEKESPIVMSNRIPTAIYARLSDHNNGYDTSDSINTQVKLVEEYIERHPELELIEEFIDNGHTGTNFHRPEFIRMMEEVKSGHIRCIVIKDLSRFGRDYLETGYYIETIFPLLGVRLVSVNENLDTARASDRDSIMIPIKNMINEMYAKDVSKKRSATFEMKRKNGIPYLGTVPFGYKLSDDGKRFEINPETIRYAKMIFSWFEIGVTRNQIIERFKLIGVPTPLKSQKKEGKCQNQKDSIWGNGSINYILGNPVYAGICALGKTKMSLYEGISKKNVKREDWVYIDNVHDSIITKEEYEKISRLLMDCSKSVEQKRKKSEEHRNKLSDCFKGKVRCGECNVKMVYRRDRSEYKSENNTFAHYYCSTKRSERKCKSQGIQQNYLKMIVMESIRNLIKNMCDISEILKKIQKDELKSNNIRLLRRTITSHRGKIKELENKKAIIYTDFSNGLIDEEDYRIIRERVIVDIQEYENEIKELEEKLLLTQKMIEKYVYQADELKKYLEIEGFNQQLVDLVVKEILVYNDNRIKIIFNMEDIIENEIIKSCIKGVEV